MSENKSVESKPQSVSTVEASTSGRAKFFPRTPQNIAITAFALGLVAAYCSPWVVFNRGNYNGIALEQLDASLKILWLIPGLSLVTIGQIRKPDLFHKLGTTTAVTTLLCVGFLHLRIRSDLMVWGVSLTRWLAFALFAFSGQLQSSSLVDLVAKKLGSRKAEAYGHSGSFTSDCHFSAQEFYAGLESSILAKEWPGVQLLHIDYGEAGLLSHKREYLRIIRQRHIFDICAATFGKDYFFSVREAELPAVVDIRSLIVILAVLSLLTTTFIQKLGLLFGSLSMAFLVAFVIWLLFNVVKLGLIRLDSLLVQLPVIGPVYEAWFRKDTYFQQDSRLIFLQAVTELVKDHVTEAVSGSGIKLLSNFEYQPILEGLYKRTRIDLSEPEPAPTAK